MARTSNTKLLKSNDKTKASTKGSNDAASKKAGKIAETPAIEVKTKKEVENKEVSPVAAGEKKVSQKLLETLEKRRKNQLENGRSAFGKPAGRRGRRPKAMAEYTPGNQEEEAYVLESEAESIEYDTGIRVKDHADDRGYNMDVDFDEELNFDW